MPMLPTNKRVLLDDRVNDLFDRPQKKHERPKCWLLSYGGLATFDVTAAGSALGVSIRRFATQQYVVRFNERFGYLPSGNHTVPWTYGPNSGHFNASFPSKDIAATYEQLSHIFERARRPHRV